LNLISIVKLLAVIIISIFFITKGVHLLYKNSYHVKVDKTCHTMKEIQQKVEIFYIDHEHYPKTLTLLGIQTAPLDAWENEINYLVTEDSYRLISHGKEKKFTLLSCQKDKSSRTFGRVLEAIIHALPIFFIIYLAMITFRKNEENKF